MEIVNGYMCRDCTDVSYAKKNIDPAHPKDDKQPREQPSKTNPESVQWGEEIRMDKKVIDAVTEKWGRLGLPGEGKPIWK